MNDKINLNRLTLRAIDIFRHADDIRSEHGHLYVHTGSVLQAIFRAGGIGHQVLHNLDITEAQVKEEIGVATGQGVSAKDTLTGEIK